MKRIAVLALMLVLAGGALGVAERISVTFWSAPHPPQEVFWRSMAEKFNAIQDEIHVYVTAMVEAPTSEATILAAIAGGKAPAGSENIFPGFGGVLAEANALVPLDTLPGFDELIEKRAMVGIIDAWRFADGHVYILPIYANAMLFAWRIDILRELGFDAPPTTYGGIMEVGEALKERYPDKYVLARDELVDPTWWQRWFDFFMLYYAASDGQPFITGNEVTADDDAVIEVFKFYRDLNEKGYLLTAEVLHPFETGLSIWTDHGPWTFPVWREMWPELRLGETFVLAPPPLPDDVDLPYAKTFADAKGLVIYAQRSEAEQLAIWEFIRWVFADPIHDREWVDTTGMLPLREDVATNPVFARVFDLHPELLPYAEQMPYAVPAITHPKFADIQTALGEEGLIPVIEGVKTPEQGWADAKAAIEAILAGS